MSLHFEIVADDLRALGRALRTTADGQRELRRQYMSGIQPTVIPLMVVATVLFVGRAPLFSYGLLVLMPLGVHTVVWTIYYRRALALALERRAHPPRGFGLGPHVLRVSDDGIHELQPYGETHHRWSVVNRLLEAEDHLFLPVLPAGHYIVPKRAFRGEGEIQEFRDLVLRGVAGSERSEDAGEQAVAADEARSR